MGGGWHCAFGLGWGSSFRRARCRLPGRTCRRFCMGEPLSTRRCTVLSCFAASVISASGLRILWPWVGGIGWRGILGPAIGMAWDCRREHWGSGGHRSTGGQVPVAQASDHNSKGLVIRNC